MSKEGRQKRWRVFAKKTIHKNPWFSVDLEDIQKPSGHRDNYYIFQGTGRKDFVVAIALDDNYFYLTEQWRPTLKKYSLEFVAGRAEKNESYLEAVKREFLEETGLEAKKWLLIGRVAVAPGHTPRYGRIFLASRISHSNTKTKGEPGEDTKLVKVPKNKFREMIYQAKIDDGPTLSAYLLYLIRSKKI